jgi:small-conductance mechanosensitive channel
MNKPWLQILVPLENLIQWEVFILIWVLVLFAWGFYKFFLKRLSEERHRNLHARFVNLNKQLFSLTILFGAFFTLDSFKEQPLLLRVLPYIGLATVVLGCITFIQLCRILLLQYLFLTSIRTAVPLLLVNIFTLVLSLFLGGWLITTVFGIQVAPLLATSAAFSIILGLALQDTLGNLFAGISLQIDHSFEIGDWIEVTSGIQKITGQVVEITWRSTILVGLFDELINIPNRFMAQSQINNWTRPDVPIARSQSLRIPYHENLEHVTETLNEALQKVPNICKNPRPIALVSEPGDSWVIIKVIYYLEDYGRYATAADAVIRECLHALRNEGITVAHPMIEVTSSEGASQDSTPKI